MMLYRRSVTPLAFGLVEPVMYLLTIALGEVASAVLNGLLTSIGFLADPRPGARPLRLGGAADRRLLPGRVRRCRPVHRHPAA